jgi:hypothetical protein
MNSRTFVAFGHIGQMVGRFYLEYSEYVHGRIVPCAWERSKLLSEANRLATAAKSHFLVRTVAEGLVC